MKKPLWIPIVAVLLLASCGGGGGSGAVTTAAQQPSPPASPTASELLRDDLQGLPLDEFYFDSYEALLQRIPEVIVWRGLTEVFPPDSIGLNNVSDAYQRETFAMHEVVLEMLLTYDRSTLTADEQLTYDIYEWQQQDEIDRLQFIYYDFVATYNFYGIHRDSLDFFTAVHPLENRQDAENYVTRLNAIDEKFAQLATHLNLQNGAGVIEPALTLDTAIFYMGEIADVPADTTPYYTVFVDKVTNIAGLSAADRQALFDSALSAVTNSVIPGYQQLRQRMQNLLAGAPPSIGVAQYPLGSDYYNNRLKHHTTSDMTAAEIHQLGLDELLRIQEEMRVIFDQLGYPQNETMEQLYARVETDGGTIAAVDVKSTYEGMVALAEQNQTAAFDIFPSAPVIVAEDDFGGYYIGPSYDGTRPGAFYAGTENDEAYYRMPSLTYHESVPGHHSQIAIQMDQDTPIFRKMSRVTAFVEGWGLYAERVAYELNWYDNDPYGDLGRLQYEALRATRLVVDTGIHSMGWSFDQSVQYIEDNLGLSEGAAQSSAGRYSVVPAQATAYMVGMLQIIAARQRAIDALEAQFDIKEFHRLLLSNGAVPMAIMNREVDRWVQEKLAAP
jgi:uncharacterized protein (DUF885 family)